MEFKALYEMLFECIKNTIDAFNTLYDQLQVLSNADRLCALGLSRISPTEKEQLQSTDTPHLGAH